MNSQPVLNHPAWLVGVGESPYTRKLRSVLRFRRIPHRFVVSGSKEASLLPAETKSKVDKLLEGSGCERLFDEYCHLTQGTG